MTRPRTSLTRPLTPVEYQQQVAADMTERLLQENVRRLARALGWLVYHTHDSRRSEPGFPDLVLVHADGRVLLYRELKTQRGRLTQPQRDWLLALERAGANVGVWRPIDWLTGSVERALTPPTWR